MWKNVKTCRSIWKQGVCSNQSHQNLLKLTDMAVYLFSDVIILFNSGETECMMVNSVLPLYILLHHCETGYTVRIQILVKMTVYVKMMVFCDNFCFGLETGLTADKTGFFPETRCMVAKHDSPKVEFMVTIIISCHAKCLFMIGKMGSHMMDRNYLFKNCLFS